MVLHRRIGGARSLVLHTVHNMSRSSCTRLDGLPGSVLALLFAACLAASVADSAQAARLERFRASVHPATGEMFSCRSNADLLCAYKQCARSHPDAGSRGRSCQKLSVADVGDGTEPFCAVGLYRLAEDAAEQFGAVACANSAAEAEQAARSWGRDNDKPITAVHVYPETASEAKQTPSVEVTRETPPYIVIYAEVTNGRRAGGGWAYCTNVDLAKARRCAEQQCSQHKEYGASCVETGYAGREGTCAVANAKGFGISWGSCAESASEARDAALADCRDQARRHYPDDQASCGITWEQKK